MSPCPCCVFSLQAFKLSIALNCPGALAPGFKAPLTKVRGNSMLKDWKKVYVGILFFWPAGLW